MRLTPSMAASFAMEHSSRWRPSRPQAYEMSLPLRDPQVHRAGHRVSEKPALTSVPGSRTRTAPPSPPPLVHRCRGGPRLWRLIASPVRAAAAAGGERFATSLARSDRQAPRFCLSPSCELHGPRSAAACQFWAPPPRLVPDVGGRSLHRRCLCTLLPGKYRGGSVGSPSGPVQHSRSEVTGGRREEAEDRDPRPTGCRGACLCMYGPQNLDSGPPMEAPLATGMKASPCTSDLAPLR